MTTERAQATMYGDLAAQIITQILPNTACELDHDEWARVASRAAQTAWFYAELAWIADELERMRGITC